MQSDRTTFCGDVVLDSINLTFGIKEMISDQICEKKIYFEFYQENFNLDIFASLDAMLSSLQEDVIIKTVMM